MTRKFEKVALIFSDHDDVLRFHFLKSLAKVNVGDVPIDYIAVTVGNISMNASYSTDTLSYEKSGSCQTFRGIIHDEEELDELDEFDGPDH